ncbi:Hypothetical protein A7982_07566 [Minicystis rosea]|nr:Hypothetical protein A7982_07566 [Minicystis rosea]
MKTTSLFGWVGLALLISTASCSKSPEGFCESWVEDTCQAITGCCASGSKFDLDQCRIELSQSCQAAVDVERVHAGEVVFHSGAANDCFGTVETCADLKTSTLGSFERVAACKNVLTGFRPPGAACSQDSDCAQAGEYASCFRGSGNEGVCAEVVLDEEKCSFSFDTNELHVCPDEKFCDTTAFEPSSTAPPTSKQFEFSASCRARIGSGKSCVDAEMNLLPCADGLYCDFTSGNNATCAARKPSGATCSSSNECKTGLICTGQGLEQTCQGIEDQGEFCYQPTTCGNGSCEVGETASSCPDDCATTGNDCGDGFCANGEAATCPDDCCGDATCDPGEEFVCPNDCAP